MEIPTMFKSGDTCAEVRLYRYKGGLSLNIRAHPIVEEFMKSLGDGKSLGTEAYGKEWFPVASPVEVYNMSPAAAVGGQGYRLDLPSRALGNGEMVNLSFLRIAGISLGEGVTFGIKGVYSLEALKELKDAIGVAIRRLVIEYIRPVDFTVTIGTQ